MDKKITLSLELFLKKELQSVMDAYEKFRLETAKTYQEEKEIKEALKAEVFWENKIAQIKGLMKGQQVVRPKKQREKVSLGSELELVFNGGRKERIFLDGAGYRNHQATIVSVHSPLGHRLLGRKINDTVSYNGTEVEIKKISYPW